MAALGFDFEHGRLDESLHPFCGGVPDDVRMTARYDETDVASGLMAVLHETGHALYNAGLPKAWRGQPVGRRARPRCTRASRSCSRCRSAARAPSSATWRRSCARPSSATATPSRADNLYRAAIRVGAQPDPGRCRRGHLSAPHRAALPPRAGAAGGRPARSPICPAPGTRACASCSASARRPTARACLQDIHWPAGAFGYFPVLHARRSDGGPAVRGPARRPAGARGPDRARRLPPAARLAAGQHPRAGLAARHPDPAHQDNRPSARRRSRSWPICRGAISADALPRLLLYPDGSLCYLRSIVARRACAARWRPI